MNPAKVWTAALTVVIVVLYAVGSTRWVETGSGWYRSLHRPAWQPPDAVFGIAWTYNFAVIIVSGIVVAAYGTSLQRGVWLGALPVSVAAALSWAWLFYVRHSLWASSLALLAAVVVTAALVWAAWTTRLWAGAILLPYLVWLALATSLSMGYAHLNPG